MPKLTDTQLVILSAAARRQDGAALPLPKSLKLQGGAATTVLKNLVKKGLLEERPASREAAAWRETEDGRRMTLIITEAGLQAIGVASDEISGKPAAIAEPKKEKRGKRGGRKPAIVKSKSQESPAIRAGTKQALLIDLLKRKRGATIDEIVRATGWQAHSVRGAISGTLKKKLGLAVSSEKADGRGRLYRIVGRG